MKNAEKVKAIRDILSDAYGGLLSSERTDELADEIYDCAFSERYDLADIILIHPFEEEETKAADDGDGREDISMDVFHAVLDCMEDNALTAQKLYDCYHNNIQDYEVLCKLLYWNREWLSPQQMAYLRENCSYEWEWDDEE